MVSLYACDIHGSRTLGRLGSIYVTIVRGSTKLQRKLRICPPCVEDFMSTTAGNWLSLNDSIDIPDTGVCSFCDARQDPGTTWTLFGTSYVRNDDRHDYYAVYCHNCAQGLAKQLGLRPISSTGPL